MRPTRDRLVAMSTTLERYNPSGNDISHVENTSHYHLNLFEQFRGSHRLNKTCDHQSAQFSCQKIEFLLIHLIQLPSRQPHCKPDTRRSQQGVMYICPQWERFAAFESMKSIRSTEVAVRQRSINGAPGFPVGSKMIPETS